MKCDYHPEREATAECGQCHSLLCQECAVREGGNRYFCTRCMALKSARDAANSIDDRLKARESRHEEKLERENRREKIWFALQWAILLACSLIILIKAPATVSSMKDEKPVRNGTYNTDPGTDQCIGNLWRAVKLLQEGKAPGPGLLCPESKKPYVIERAQGDTLVRCPSPEKHRFAEIRASRELPVPEVIK